MEVTLGISVGEAELLAGWQDGRCVENSYLLISPGQKPILGSTI